MRFLIVFILLVPVVVFSQTKGDTKIIVTVSDTSNLFNRIALQLIDNGYGIEMKDADLKYIATSEKALKNLRPPPSFVLSLKIQH